MGRGSGEQQEKHTRAGRGGSSSSAAPAAAAPAAPAPAAPAAALPGEDVWRLLLGQLWQQPDQRLVCRLLCCSAAMCRVVHEACAGRAAVRARLADGPDEDAWELHQGLAAAGQHFSRWLAKHARLLARLELDIRHEQEQDVAAGLCAAAGLSAMDICQRLTRAQAAAFDAVIEAAAAGQAAAGGAAAGLQHRAQPLALGSLALCTTAPYSASACGVSLCNSLAACPQLTQLNVRYRNLQQRQVVDAGPFSALHCLRELSLSVKCEAALRLQLASPQLTKLCLKGVLLSPADVSRLPASLVDLEHMYGSELPQCDFAHLTGLRRLQYGMLDADDRLPASLEELHVRGVRGVRPLQLLQPLTRLHSLTFGSCDSCTSQQLEDAVRAVGPSLTTLALGRVDGPLGNALLSQRCAGALPLTTLSVSPDMIEPSISVAHLGQWIRLRRLLLVGVHITDTPQQLADQLRQLTALEQLFIGLVSRPPASPVFQPVVECLVGMCSLRSIYLGGVPLTQEQVGTLKALTRLTRLEYW